MREKTGISPIIAKIILSACARACFLDQYYGKEVQKSDSEIMIQLSESVSTGDLVSIQIHSRRQNDAYKKYYIP